MKVLIVDNGTHHLQELHRFLSKYSVTVLYKSELYKAEIGDYDLLVLSGSNRSPVSEKPQIYEKEIELVRRGEIPIVGICMGFEIIAYAFGGKLAEMKKKITGIVDVTVTNSDPIFDKYTKFKVAENHKWVVRELKHPLIELARSESGIEVLKHVEKPIYGFQFHPEMFSDKHEGDEIFHNLLSLIEKKLPRPS